MDNYGSQHHYQINDALRQDYTHTEFKTDPYELTNSQRPAFSYGGQHPYSEEELVESLGWVNYTQAPQVTTQNHGMNLTSEMSLQQHSLHHRRPSGHQSGSLASNGTFGSTSIPRANQSPSGWHSSLESSNFVTDQSIGLGHGGLQNNNDGSSNNNNHVIISDSSRKEGHTAPDKRALRRYSHNAVERRRRDNINEQIQELSNLVTEMNASQSTKTETVMTGPPSNTKPNKGAVLRRSVEYIRLLKCQVDEKEEREKRLEQEILRLGGKVPPHVMKDPAVSMWIDESAIAEDDD